MQIEDIYLGALCRFRAVSSRGNLEREGVIFAFVGSGSSPSAALGATAHAAAPRSRILFVTSKRSAKDRVLIESGVSLYCIPIDEITLL